ncbi:hypothetical protein ACERIM_17500 [Natrinema sp. H-ect1]|uniref:hypothetical protein n=1 Tax=unclassified Natrinema TaxID=2622230 RepID=UPI00155F408A
MAETAEDARELAETVGDTLQEYTGHPKDGTAAEEVLVTIIMIAAAIWLARKSATKWLTG